MSTNNPHDALVHAVFSRLDNAAGELRAVLPARITAAIDWSTLRLETGHHTDPALEDTYSDLVYSARLAGHPVLLYVLFEHQSSEDPMMALRLLRYILRVWDAWRGDNPNAKKLPSDLAHKRSS